MTASTAEVDLLPSQPESTPEKKQSTRRFLKCDECRNRKRKCWPPVRDFAAGEKCDGCQKAGLPCSPNRKKNDVAHEPPAHPTPHIPSSPSISPPRPTSASVARVFRELSRPSVSAPGFGDHRPKTPDGGIPDDRLRRSGLDVAARWEQGFENLRGGLELVHYYRLRRSAVHRMCPARTSEEYSQQKQAFDFREQCASYKFTSELKHLLGSIECADVDIERPLQRLLQLTRDFLAPPPGFIQELRRLEGAALLPELPNKSVSITYTRILWHLVQLYDRQGRADNADQHCQDLIVFYGTQEPLSDEQPELASRLLKAVQQRSVRLMKAHTDLEIPPHSRPGSDCHQNLFPATHIAISSRLPVLTQDEGPPSPSQVQQADMLGRSRISLAIETGDEALVVDMLARSSVAELNERDIFGTTPMLLAARIGHPGIFNLVKVWSNLDAIDYRGRTALVMASEYGNDDIVKDLLESGCSADQSLPGQAYSALYIASDRGNASTVRILIDGGATLQPVRLGEVSPEQAALHHGHQEIVVMLKEARAKRTISTTRAPHKGTPQTLSRHSTVRPASPPEPSPNCSRRSKTRQSATTGQKRKSSKLSESQRSSFSTSRLAAREDQAEAATSQAQQSSQHRDNTPEKASNDANFPVEGAFEPFSNANNDLSGMYWSKFLDDDVNFNHQDVLPELAPEPLDHDYESQNQDLGYT